jgi:sugar/nucleoside kinase (ribokinase family)
MGLVNVVFARPTSIRVVAGKQLMRIKTILKKIKRGDILKINWIDAGDLEDSPSSWFSQEDAEKVFKEIPVETIAVYFGHGKENLFLVRDTEKQDISSPYYNGACVIPIGCIRSVEKLSN